MDSQLVESILAVVANPESQELARSGAAPIFIARSREEQQRLGLLLSRILKAMAHDLENGLLIIVRH